MELLFLWTKRVVVFLLFSTVLINIAGKNGKYIKVISGFMLILLMAEPFMKLLGGGQLLEYELQKEIFAYDAHVPDYISEKADAFVNKAVTENYHALIKENTAAVGAKYGLQLCDFKVKTNENVTESEYGRVLEISCDFEHVKINSKIKEIEVAVEVDIKIAGKEKGEKSKESKIENLIKSELADFYNMSVDNIYIYIREGR